MSNCARKKRPAIAEPSASSTRQANEPFEANPSSLINFLVDATKKLQAEDANLLPILRGIIQNCPGALSGDEAKNYEEAAVDAVFDLTRVLLELVNSRWGPESQVAALALFNVIPAVVGVRKCVQFLISSTSALSNMYTKHWSSGMIHWGRAPNYEKPPAENMDCFARLQRMHYMMRILNCRKDMLEQQTNMLREQLKKHQMVLAGPSRARSKRRYHKRDMVSAEDFFTFKSSLKKQPDHLAQCLQKMIVSPGTAGTGIVGVGGIDRCTPHTCECAAPSDRFSVNFKPVKAPDILLEIFESLFEDPYVLIRREFSWDEENVVEEQRFWHSISLQLHLVHGAMESPSAMEIYADLYEECTTFACFFNVIEIALLCPATRYHPLAAKNLHSWLDMAAKFTQTPIKTHNPKLADDVLGGIKKTLCILNSSFWDPKLFSKTFQLHNLTKTAFGKIKDRVKDPDLLLLDWTEVALKELPWRNKRKLQMLAELIPLVPDVDIKRITRKKSGSLGFGASLIESIAYNELRSACCDLFKAVLERFSKEQFVREFVPLIESSLANKSLHPGLSNYWIPVLVKKYPDVVQGMQSPNLAGSIILVKALRKEGLISLKDLLNLRDGQNGDILASGLQCSDIDTRVRALTALCQGPNIQASWTESLDTLRQTLFLVQHFIESNLTMTSQASRNMVMKALFFLFSNIRDFILTACRLSKDKEVNFKENSLTSHIVELFLWLGEFTCKGLELGFSYQRNLFTLRLYDLVLTVFSPPEKNLKQKTAKLVTALKAQNVFPLHSKELFTATMKCILSPAEDVRLKASSIILNTPEFDVEPKFCAKYTEVALHLCSAQKSNDVEAGALLYKTVAGLCNTPPLKSIEMLTAKAREEFDVVKSDLLKGAMENQPVYGCMQAILFVLPKEVMWDLSELEETLALVEEVSAHFLKVFTSKSSTQEFAPSFEDMDWAIESEINKNYSMENKSLHLSPQFQYALNCAWLNLKVCSELAYCLSNLVYTSADPETQLWRCSVVIMNVLQKCRHKGAFEAAGVTLGCFVRKLTMRGSGIPKKMLEKLMATLNLTGTDAPPLSRRSAGLAVAIHKIVSADSSSDKELLHDTIEQLLLPTETKQEPSVERKSGLYDDVITRRMHVLYTLVTDASIGHHINCHLENIGQMSIYFLNADDWGVKNAAMQLFGAFVKKIATQRKSRSDDEIETDENSDWDIAGNGLLEDMLVRSSYLMSQVIAIIKYPQPEKNEDQCSQLVPCCNPPDENAISCVLGFLQCLTPGPPSLSTQAQASLVNEVVYYSWRLLGHPSWLVRRQAATCFVTFTNRSNYTATFKQVMDDLDKADSNQLHGTLLMTSALKRKMAFFKEDTKKLEGPLKELEAKVTSKLLVDFSDCQQRSSFLLYKYAQLEALKKEEAANLLLSIASTDTGCEPQNFCEQLFASELVEHVVTYQSDWVPMVLALCSSYQGLSCVKQHLLQSLSKLGGDITSATEEQLEIVLSYDIDQLARRHELLAVMKPLVLRKDQTRHDILCKLEGKSIWNFNSATAGISLAPNFILCDQLIKLLSQFQVMGDDFESAALSLVAHIIVESIAAGNVDFGRQKLLTFTKLMTRYLDKAYVPELSILGPALVTISPVVWEAREVGLDESGIGSDVLMVTIALLLDQDENAVKSVWPLRSSTSYVCETNSALCLQQIHQLAVGTLTTPVAMEQYLWDTLKMNPHFSSSKQDINSPFSHGIELELDFFEHSLPAFECLYKYNGFQMNEVCVPGRTELEDNCNYLVSVLEKTPELHIELCVLPAGLIVELHKMNITLIALEKFYNQDCSTNIKALKKATQK